MWARTKTGESASNEIQKRASWEDSGRCDIGILGWLPGGGQQYCNVTVAQHFRFRWIERPRRQEDKMSGFIANREKLIVIISFLSSPSLTDHCNFCSPPHSPWQTRMILSHQRSVLENHSITDPIPIEAIAPLVSRDQQSNADLTRITAGRGDRCSF